MLDSVLTPRFYRPENMPPEFLSFSIRLPLFIIAAACLTQCATQPPTPTLSPPDDTFWVDAHPEGTPKIVISLEEQRVGLFKGNQLVGLSPISSGKEGNHTRPGVFKVTEKDDDHRSSWYGAFVDEMGNIVVEDVDARKDTPPAGTKFMGASMNWFMRFNGAIGMHQGYLPGYPASHGCIRLPEKMAILFYEATPHGATVEVRKKADLIALKPKDSEITSRQLERSMQNENTQQDKLLASAETLSAKKESKLDSFFFGRRLSKSADKLPDSEVKTLKAPEIASNPSVEEPKPKTSFFGKHRNAVASPEGERKSKRSLMVAPTKQAPLEPMPRLRPVTPIVPGAPVPPMTLAPIRPTKVNAVRPNYLPAD